METLKEIMLVGDENHLCFVDMGKRGMITEPVYINKWWFEPLTNQTIPIEGVRIIEEIKRRVEIQGVIYAHEAPKLLTAEKKKYDFKISKHILTSLGILGGVLLAISALASSVANALVFLMLLAFVDPALVVVTKDGEWVMVMSWLE